MGVSEGIAIKEDFKRKIDLQSGNHKGCPYKNQQNVGAGLVPAQNIVYDVSRLVQSVKGQQNLVH